METKYGICSGECIVCKRYADSACDVKGGEDGFIPNDTAILTGILRTGYHPNFEHKTRLRDVLKVREYLWEQFLLGVV